MSPTIRIHGRGGRLGAEVARLAGAAGLQEHDGASVHLVALPWRVAAERIDALPHDHTVIDLSGALKVRGAGRYGLLHAGRLLDGGLPALGDRLTNPGCMAGTVVHALLRTGLRGELHATITGGSSMAGADGAGLRTGHRWLDHPHVAEIERALPDVRLASFTPVVAHAHGRGLVVVVNGRGEVAPRAGSVDTTEIVGTAEVRLRVDSADGRVTISAAADNLTLPAHNAVELVRLLQVEVAASPGT